MSDNQNPSPNSLTVRKPDSQWDVPSGVYIVRFKGIKETNHPEYGVGLCWSFEVVEGGYKGKLVERNTAPEPTPNNSCGRIIKGLLGRPVLEGETIDVAQFEGRIFRAIVVQKPKGQGVRVDSVEIIQQQGAQPAQQPVQQPVQLPDRGPRRPGPAAAPAKALRRWWLAPGAGQDALEKTLTDQEVLRYLEDNKADPAVVLILPEHAKDGEEWQSCLEHGLDNIPY